MGLIEHKPKFKLLKLKNKIKIKHKPKFKLKKKKNQAQTQI